MRQHTELKSVKEYRRLDVRHEIEAASPHRLIQLLMERFIARVALARKHMERGAVADKGQCISDAISIVSGLRASLNHEPDAKLSGNFDALYDYMTRRLLESNLKDDVEGLNEVLHLMREIKTAWDVIGDRADELQQPSPAPV